MKYLIKPFLLNEYIQTKNNLVIVDLRWYIDSPEKGLLEYEKEHIPTSIFIDLEKELSEHSDISKGRHPLPSPQVFTNLLTEKGISQDSFIVIYDDAGGAIASRLWWMLRWIGGPESLILDGGFQSWKNEKLPVESGIDNKFIKQINNPIIPKPKNEFVVTKEDIIDNLNSQKFILIDSRDKSRYTGELEPIDPIGGHIPDSINYPYKGNLNSSFEFLDSEKLKENFNNLGIDSDKNIVCYCGSGVTSCHNIIALEMAGFKTPKLYVGSWSEWCRDKNLKIVQ